MYFDGYGIILFCTDLYIFSLFPAVGLFSYKLIVYLYLLNTGTKVLPSKRLESNLLLLKIYHIDFKLFMCIQMTISNSVFY